MTPATRLLDARAVDYVLHRYEHTAAQHDYGFDASQQLGVAPERVFKTLVTELDTHALVVAVVAVAQRLHMKRLAAAAGARRAFMAESKAVERATGYMLGGISPLAQKQKLACFIDRTAQNFDTIFISGGRRGLEIEITASDLAKLVDAPFVDLAR